MSAGLLTQLGNGLAGALLLARRCLKEDRL